MKTPAMTINSFIKKLASSPEETNFDDAINTIDQNYHFTPAEFYNGELHNPANQNNGSCKIFAFAKLHGLTAEQTLHCFGNYYRVDVLQNPDGSDHQNIRNFIIHGWDGIRFSTEPLSPVISEENQHESI